MSKIQINLPNNFQFCTEIKIRITDINYGGHLGNDSMLSVMQEARIRYLQKLGFRHEGNGPDGIGIIIRDVGIVYKKECHYGTTLKISIAAQEVSRKFCNLYYRIADSSDDQDVGIAQTKIIFYDYQSQVIRKISDQLYSKLLSEII